ncbi:MAG TPA: hypothetical protein VKU00_04735 [Chthonomonadaceae bacterium]|nr:hypothetical protein [Chthonomonadaceae bacterium]
MAQPEVLEGQWEDILAGNAARLVGRKVRITIEPEENTEEAPTLEDAITKLNSRTPEEIAAARKRILDASPEPRPLPEGKTLAEVVMGQWPGDETDEEIHEALRKLS